MSSFHLVHKSLWPLFSSLGVLGMVVGLVFWFYYKIFFVTLISMCSVIMTSIMWWRDVTRESMGNHTTNVVQGLKLGMILFILSEVMFFFSFFWAFFSSSGAPTVEVGSCWPPVGIEVINPFQVPLLNTLTLLTSGVTLTWSHHCFFNQDYKGAIVGLGLSIMLGFYFTILQWLEFTEASFSINDSVYGSTFFVTTGFHGLHVIIGSIFLAIGLIRITLQHFSSSHHTGFEAAAWYWHFVDVVWLFLFVFLYWWAK
uniref:Cytochrome c oxidase subunit 3 n=1 Tax=Tubulipora flabellaris TaxID=365325 RepID=F6GPJ6_9BILA|nr:cytochrome c oxidase subunit III [Tubulipora flabellaris]ACB12467.1 cytochrome c oxidase subunit III [Tubulipora flabellaris]